MVIKLFLLLALLSGCVHAPREHPNDKSGLGWGYEESVDYDGITRG